MIAGLYRKMSLAKAVSGRPVRSQMLDILKLYLGRGKLGPSEYFDYRLFEDKMQRARSGHEFAGYKIVSKIDRHWNNRTSWVITGDKLLFYSALHGFGLPHPEIYAVTHPHGRQTGLAECFSDESRLTDFLKNKVVYPFFSKPIFGSFGSGAFSVLGIDHETDELLLAKGGRVQAEEFSRLLLEPTRRKNKALSGNIIQQTLQPHESILESCGPNISGVRVVTLLEDTRPRLISAVWKITTGENFVDNFHEGKLGNMLGNIDIDSGEITRVQQGIGLERKENTPHPDTGRSLLGYRLPDWQLMKEICLAASTIAPELRFQHWDVALTDQGPVLLELNVHGSLDLIQLATETGVLSHLG